LAYKIAYSVLVGIRYFLVIFSWLIVINALLSWFIDPSHPIRELLDQFISPIVNPFRRITDRFLTSGIPIDLAPLFALISIQILTSIIGWVLLQISPMVFYR